jgi:hypothetical protein
MNYGFIPNEQADVYHATDAVSNSKLKLFKRQQKLYFRKYVEKSLIERVDTTALRLGRAAHHLTLEGQAVYDAEVALLPADAPNRPSERQRNAAKPSPETMAAIKWWDDFNAKNAGRVVASADEHALNVRMAASVHAHPLAPILIDSTVGLPETTWRVKLADLDVQVRPDYFNPAGCALTDGRPYILDLKTCASLDEDDFGNFLRNFYAFGYYRQAALYQAVVSEIFGPIQDFLFVAVEKKEPFETRIYRPTLRAVQMGWEEVKADLRALGECYKTGIWKEGPTDILSIDVPDWYANREAKKELAKLAA